jgi:hypothetical protein
MTENGEEWPRSPTEFLVFVGLLLCIVFFFLLPLLAFMQGEEGTQTQKTKAKEGH